MNRLRKKIFPESETFQLWKEDPAWGGTVVPKGGTQTPNFSKRGIKKKKLEMHLLLSNILKNVEVT